MAASRTDVEAPALPRAATPSATLRRLWRRPSPRRRQTPSDPVGCARLSRPNRHHASRAPLPGWPKKDDTSKLFIEPGGMLINSRVILPSVTASKCPHTASKCQFGTNSVIGSNTCHASFTNAYKLHSHRERTAGTDLSTFLASRSALLLRSASLKSALVTRPR